MTQHKANLIFTMMATLLSHITPQEASRKTDKLRKSIRLKLNELHRKDKAYYLSMANDAQKAWNTVEKELNNINYEVLLSVALMALYSFVERTEFKESWFRERVFLDAIASMENHHRNPKIDDPDKIERDSNMVVDLLCKAIDVSRPSMLGNLKLKIKHELALENKLPIERVA